MSTQFSASHFELLKRWRGQARDEQNPDQNGAYAALKGAYEITQAWAEGIRSALFPAGRVEVRKRPTNQANNFAAYNWARIYPSGEAPKALAFTVGMDAERGYVVKIDTVGFDDNHPTRKAYLEIRGLLDNTSPLVAVMSEKDGLRLSLDELVSWSVDRIRRFGLSYEDVAEALKIESPLGDEDLLRHFDGKLEFKTFRQRWSEEERSLFCRLARAVHAAGLDWWHIDLDIEVRFGRKHPGRDRADGVLGRIQGTQRRTLAWKHPLGTIRALDPLPLTSDLVDRIEVTLAGERQTLNEWLGAKTVRPGLWPDQFEAAFDQGEDVDLEDIPAKSEVRLPINRIYYGPPGTSKTHEVSRLLKPAYEYIDDTPTQGDWREQFISRHLAALTWWEVTLAALYDLGGERAVAELREHPFLQAMGKTNGRATSGDVLWTTLGEHAIETSTTVNMTRRLAPGVFEKTADSRWYLAGPWREACAGLIETIDELKAGHRVPAMVKRYAFVTFHQSYGYEEFVEGLRPVLGEASESGSVRYEIRAGTFKDLCRRARAAPDQRFAMVIDEINRGNISKIFGELITLIEADKREGMKNALSVTLPYSGESFSVPANVDIFGTMNTSDRSLALLDTALRRRFEFVAAMPDARDSAGAPLGGLRVTIGKEVINIPRLLEAINQRIEALHGRDHCIGHAYFMPLRDLPDGDARLIALQGIFKHRILPLLEEYFFEDWGKIRLVLADNQKREASLQFVIESSAHEDDLARLFGVDHGLDSYTVKRGYDMQDAALSRPQAYIGIYETLSLRQPGRE